MSLNSKQLGSVFAVLAIALVGAFIVKDAGTNPMFAVMAVGVVAAGIVALSGGGGGAEITGLSDAIRRAAAGDRIKSPPEATGELARVYDELVSLSEARKTEQAELEARATTLKGTDKALDEVAQKLRDGMSAQAVGIDETSRLVRDLAAALRDVSTHVESLTSSAEESSSSILRDDRHQRRGRREHRRARRQRARDRLARSRRWRTRSRRSPRTSTRSR